MVKNICGHTNFLSDRKLLFQRIADSHCDQFFILKIGNKLAFGHVFKVVGAAQPLNDNDRFVQHTRFFQIIHKLFKLAEQTGRLIQVGGSFVVKVFIDNPGQTFHIQPLRNRLNLTEFVINEHVGRHIRHNKISLISSVFDNILSCGFKHFRRINHIQVVKLLTNHGQIVRTGYRLQRRIKRLHVIKDAHTLQPLNYQQFGAFQSRKFHIIKTDRAVDFFHAAVGVADAVFGAHVHSARLIGRNFVLGLSENVKELVFVQVDIFVVNVLETPVTVH